VRGEWGDVENASTCWGSEFEVLESSTLICIKRRLVGRRDGICGDGGLCGLCPLESLKRHPLERERGRRLDFVEVSTGDEGVVGGEKMDSPSFWGRQLWRSPWKEGVKWR
jgi:hypothetical protein